ncbi:three-Cys-motif partner protein TcmP [Adlercreutzia sp. ZJ154]|uniref:three-Cys-motif partner protein TcmP n=1 Tax=Adlercreutzia sp. ZJ154 TaxID=2709790 RepID=UPI0013EB27D2|nr:three-Cys-motif partner protein TcmP [Adlercreutzia sp. ZJ154]
MNIDLEKILSQIGCSANKLDNKKEQTSKKIEYVTHYVKEWIRVGCMSSKLNTLSFVDGMSNAGIYRDGDLGTTTLAYSLFLEAAKSYPNMHFNLVFNEIDPIRFKIFKVICHELYVNQCGGREIPNLKLYCSNDDINDFIADLSNHDGLLNKYGSLTLFFIDPYDARTVDIPPLRDYLNNHYCELFFNWFSSDHVRNPNDNAIKSCFSGIEIPAGYDAADYIAKYLSGSKKMYFSFPFRNKNNTELYQIIFVTPSKKGLEKVKEALWSTFSGREYHRNERTACHQTSMFELDEGRDFQKESYGATIRDLILDEFTAKDYSYDEIELFVLRRSMLGPNDILRFVVKPLIKQGVLLKNNRRGKRNYKDDSYRFIKGTGND